jgi:glycosyltransferase involved in cell wall biosynthesis
MQSRRVVIPGSPLRIAQVSPLHESVPPALYGGTERVVSYLTEELVGLGHDVTLFASGGSRTSARLVECCASGLRLAGCAEPLAHHLAMVEQVLARRQEFDIVHFHIDYVHFPACRRDGVTSVTTLHGRLVLPELEPLYRMFPEMPVISISDAQRAPLPWLSWGATIHHGLPVDLYRFEPDPGDYLLFIGRMSPEKRLDRAIEIATRAGVPLKIAAKLAPADRDHYDRILAPLLCRPNVEVIGEVGERDKQKLIGRARALVFPIDWPEPFGLVMIEAMACGTPVIAFRRGSVSEVIDDGVTGFVCDDVAGAVDAVGRLSTLSRAAVRAAFERRFTARRMALDYVDVYRRLVDARRDLVGRRPVLHPRDEHARQ